MNYLNRITSVVLTPWFAVVAPLRRLAEREGTAPNNDMRATRVVKAVLGVQS